MSLYRIVNETTVFASEFFPIHFECGGNGRFRPRLFLSVGMVWRKRPFLVKGVMMGETAVFTSSLLCPNAVKSQWCHGQKTEEEERIGEDTVLLVILYRNKE